MPVRDTSIQAYREIEESGLLSRRRFQVYQWLYRNGPATAMAVARGLAPENTNHASYTPRVTELRNRGVVVEVGVGVDLVSGKSAILWDVNSNLPVTPEKKKTKVEVLEEEIASLKAQLLEARGEIAASLNREDELKVDKIHQQGKVRQLEMRI